MPGQITLETAFGRELKALAANPRYRVFLDVGPWAGDGTTRCLWEGAKERTDSPRILSIEANRDWWRVASSVWRDVSGGPTVLYGRVAERMMTDKEVLEHPLYDKIKEHYALHFTQDERDFKAAPLVHLRRCDVAVLDGGEFCGRGDWAAVEPLAPRVVCLDDVNVMKNSDVLAELLAKGWKLIWRSEERNGAAILERPDASPEPVKNEGSE